MSKNSARPNELAVAGPNSRYSLPDGEPAGFWSGLWHGIISPITLVGSWFNPDVRIYEVNNNGRPYEFGFFIGVSSVFGGSRLAAGS